MGKFRKMILSLFLGSTLLISAPEAARAETSYGGSDWSVTFTADKKMESNFKTTDFADVIYGMQPGDNVIITLALKNESGETTDWYMTNEVLYSLEDRSANSSTGGGAYTYILDYTDKEGEKSSLFNSDTVGGESERGEGLKSATNALKDYFYLDTLADGESGEVRLEVALDGETQGNDYQNTLADLQMNFAVELNEAPGTGDEPDSPDRRSSSSSRTSVVQTGDESDITPFVIASCISGALLLVFSIYSQARIRKQKKGGTAV